MTSTTGAYADFEGGRMTERELFLVGVAPYWAEGSEDKA